MIADIPVDSSCCLEPVFFAAVEEYYTSGLVIEVLMTQIKLAFHGCPQSFMPNPVRGLLEVYEDMLEVLLVLDMFLIKES